MPTDSWPDWGTVPAWFGGILTGGSLMLGFYILLRDRRKEERAQASRLHCWQMVPSTSYPDGTYPCLIMIQNASDAAFLDIKVHLSIRNKDEMRRLYSGEKLGALLQNAPTEGSWNGVRHMIPINSETKDPLQGPLYSGQQALLELTTRFPSQYIRVIIQFKDAVGIPWQIDLAASKLTRLK